MARLTKQPPPPLPSLPPNLPHIRIAFKHPHYPEALNQNVLFSLKGSDTYDDERRSRDTERGGIHYGTALIACGIVAGNAWNGYFTLERDGQKLDMGHDQLLTGHAFYFHVPSASGQSFKYAIYPSFERWAFPHGNLPAEWTRLATSTESPNVPSARSNVTAAVLERDGTCLITGQRDYRERAHLCPVSEGEWFRNNYMSQYNTSTMLSSGHSTDDISNAIALRRDIYAAFDDRTFAIVSKEGSWVPHFLAATHDLGRQYHNRALMLDDGISVHHMFARFAWAIFPLVQDFLLAGSDRTVKFYVFEEGEFKEKTEVMNTGAMKTEFLTSRARSQTPRKRKARDDTQEQDTQEESEGGRNGRSKRRRVSDSEYSFSRGASGSAGSPSDTEGLAMIQDDSGDGEVNPGLPSSADDVAGTGLEGEQAWQAREGQFEKYIEDVRRRHLLKNRPKEPELYCCDYRMADALTRRGVLGKREWGGSHLCSECLGGEYTPLVEDLGEVDSN